MTSQRGFTLVELSIVLVILGLLIGGVLTGQSLIRAAELRSVATQYSRYVTAAQTFRDKYFALPGDMTNATSYWGIAAGTGTDATCGGTVSTTAATCNGNGDGQVLRINSTTPNESMRFWQHLANAGLIEGSYSGAPVLNVSSTANSPSGRISGSLWFVNYWGTQLASTGLYDGEYGNSLQFGSPIASSHAYGPIMKPEDAYNIDMKMDDGKPATGKVSSRVVLFTSNLCTDDSDSSHMSAAYLLTNTGITCGLVFRQAL